MKLRRQLKQHRAGLVPQHVEPRLHQLDAVAAVLRQALPMGDELRRLPGEHEVVRRLLEPALHGFQGRGAVEHAIEFCGGKILGIEAQMILLAQFGRKERPAPGLVVPA
jgi:hypothetical protein